ncbi:hypothetical protein C7I85_08880 [Mesorhizobium soli]|uniref:Uncharacterized protein n=1 Tax=Pseudaminobacter soli (ex Li et al. 2025) TaxID=1295366 RepID=A0A2P7SFD6_9HYPH|nr:hypothetical protein C7I85_08880 [Mesorhizobium soli]
MRYQAALHSESMGAIVFKALGRKPIKGENGTNAMMRQLAAQKSREKRRALRQALISPMEKHLQPSRGSAQMIARFGLKESYPPEECGRP